MHAHCQGRNHGFKVWGGGSSAESASQGVEGGVPAPQKIILIFYLKMVSLVHSGWRFRVVCYLELLHKRVRQKRKEEKEPW